MTRILLSLLLLAPAFTVQAENPLGKLIFNTVCFTCHGQNGEGNPQIKSPSIAGMPTWYVTRQIGNFQHDRRGFDPKDIEGQLMRATAKALDEPKVQAVAEYVATLKRVAPKQTIVAEIDRGRELFSERCMECHRYNGEGEFTFGSPPLMGLQDWYLKAQIVKFKTGQRGVEKTDPNGAKMAFSSGFIEDEDTLHSLVAYLISMQDEAAKAVDPSRDPFVKSGKAVEQVSASVQK